MDPDTIKALQGIAEVVGPFAAAPTVKELILKMLGPTAELAGERLRDNVKRCFDRSDQMIEEAKAKAIPPEPRLLLPLAQAAQIAEHQILREMFAALLANARIPESITVRPSFISIVSQLAPDEAVLFQQLAVLTNEITNFQMGINTYPQPMREPMISAQQAKHMQRLTEALPVIDKESDLDRGNRMRTCVLILEGLRLVEYKAIHPKDPVGIPLLTSLGWTLFNASSPPPPKTDA